MSVIFMVIRAATSTAAKTPDKDDHISMIIKLIGTNEYDLDISALAAR